MRILCQKQLLHKLEVNDWRTDLSFGSLHKCVLPQDLNEGYLCLHEGKPHPNAVARTPTKRHVADIRTFCLLLRSKPEEKEEGGRRKGGRKGGRREERREGVGDESEVGMK